MKSPQQRSEHFPDQPFLLLARLPPSVAVRPREASGRQKKQDSRLGGGARLEQGDRGHGGTWETNLGTTALGCEEKAEQWPS